MFCVILFPYTHNVLLIAGWVDVGANSVGANSLVSKTSSYQIY